MPYRWLTVAALILASLAGCATTRNQPQVSGVVPAGKVSPAPAPPATTATVDEHLPAPSPSNGKQDYKRVWARLVSRFAMPDCTGPEVNLHWAQWYANQPDYMARIFKRAQPWIYHIAEELERRNMPGELALLPMVESAYDPFAYSRGRAMGTWQFISDTGRRYGLKQNWWYDGRRDVWASTRAALDYLAYMHDMFEGDWLLALAGYNSGEGLVMRQVNRNKAAGKPANFWSLKLPRETRGYVPKLLGLACLFKHPEQYHFKIPATPNKPVVAAVNLGQQTDLVLVAQMSAVPIDVLFTLNPGYNRWATSPDGPYRVVLPVENAALLKSNLKKVNVEDLMKWDMVVVKRGDTLSSLAHRHHVPVDVLRSSNELNTDMIRPGQRLRLPRDAQLQIDPLYLAAADELQRLQSQLIAPDRITHLVRPGESLSVIARRYNVSVRELQRWNHIGDPRSLRAGASLVVFYTPTDTASGRGSLQYTVQEGDSLWKIARKYNVHVNDIKAWNDLGSDSYIQPGQSINIQL